jgi:hypothetical protein
MFIVWQSFRNDALPRGEGRKYSHVYMKGMDLDWVMHLVELKEP